MLNQWLSHPLTRGIDIDDPRAANLRKRVVQEKGFLRRIYREWYAAIIAASPEGNGLVLELGSGGGFLSDEIPDLVSSEVFYCPGIRVVLDAMYLPFRDGALRGIVMTDVFHHLPQARRFLCESVRCLRLGGKVIMIEPWVTAWSRLVYTRLHHEPFHPDASEWEFASSGPLTGANGALPWMVFQRDRDQFEREFAELDIEMVKPMMPFRYLVSGGVSFRSLVPEWTFGLWRLLELALERWMNTWAMFAQIVLVRIDARGTSNVRVRC